MQMGAMEVTLKKGEILFIPPLWPHHVTNINSSISFNIFTESPYHKQLVESLRMSMMFMKRVSGLNENSEIGAFFARELIIRLFRGIQPQGKLCRDNLDDWVQQHWINRYSNLWKTFLSSKESEKLQNSYRKESFAKIVKILLHDPLFLPSLSGLDDCISTIADHFSGIPSSISDEHFGDLVDVIVFVGIEPPTNLYFLKYFSS
eukprot:TRINITY_DN4374_c0_g1_i11.p1 TRINITY_DN4374_c0_g1~~TRINITY_DN4374_c0_g1_i11.p1  ORF type:complete len:204 (-),score=41.95 TRINITY_DN4374_c0_g1_i11:65-676(-)